MGLRRRVVAVGIDAPSSTLLDTWMSRGALPTLAALRARSACARLRGRDTYRAETPWTCFLTGCEPEQTGYWTLLRFSTDDYQIKDVGAYDFVEYPPFYALKDDYRVVVFDLPQTRPSDAVEGVQIISWGAHSPMAPPTSRPLGEYEEIERRFGRHPALLRDEASLWRRRELARLERWLTVGIGRRAEICAHLMRHEQWDLFLTAFGETHSAGHYFWHASQPDHPLSSVCPDDGDPLLGVYQAVDRAVARIQAATPEDTCFVVYATEGMEANCMDLPSMVFLPELLYRVCFPGRRGLGDVPGELTTLRLPSRSWVPAVWSTQASSSALRRLMRARLPSALSYRVDRIWRRAESEPLPPCDAGQLPYQPATWYRHLWPRMKAFALPSFSEGYVRLNVRGREGNGVVDASDYDRVCDELTAEISAMTDARSGKPIVAGVRRTRRTAYDESPGLPDADLIVLWRPPPTDAVITPTVGRIGPVPFYRSGGHSEDGFVWVLGYGAEPGACLPDGRPASLAPTLLTLLGAPIPEYMTQPSLL